MSVVYIYLFSHFFVILGFGDFGILDFGFWILDFGILGFWDFVFFVCFYVYDFFV